MSKVKVMSKNTGILHTPMFTPEELDRIIRTGSITGITGSQFDHSLKSKRSILHPLNNNILSNDDAVGMRVSNIESINFNKLTKRTTIVYKVLEEYVKENVDFYQISTRTTRKAATVASSEKDFVDYRVGFLLAYLKDEGKVSEKRQHALYNEVFKSGKPRITFLRGFAVHFFNSFREMDRILEAIKEEKSQVNINGNVIQITWKG